MSLAFGAHCDDFHVASRLFLKLDLAPQRETVLHFFDSVRREFPGMRKLRRREDGAVILEEEGADDGARRWIRLDNTTIRLGHHNPQSTKGNHPVANIQADGRHNARSSAFFFCHAFDRGCHRPDRPT